MTDPDLSANDSAQILILNEFPHFPPALMRIETRTMKTPMFRIMKRKTNIPAASSVVPVLGLIGTMMANATSISVNFHVGNDGNAQADHELTGSEAAGLDGNSTWNNINVGNAGNHGTAGAIFATIVLADDNGNASAASISQGGGNSTWFVGYAASAASSQQEIGLAGTNHDDLFNSYLALNSTTFGDGGPADAGYISITGLGTDFTSSGYNLIIYSDSDKRAGSTGSDRTSEYTITVSGNPDITGHLVEDDIPTPATTFSGTYVASDNSNTDDSYSNYTVITGLTASGFDLHVHSDDGGRGAISGFQIVAIPEPSVIGIIGLGLLGLGLRRRR